MTSRTEEGVCATAKTPEQMREAERTAVEEFGLDMLRGTREEMAVLCSHIDLGGDRKDTFGESKPVKQVRRNEE